MSATILGKVRLWTLVSALLISAGLFKFVDARFVYGFLGSAVWTVIGFWLVEALIRQALRPSSVGRDRRAIALLAVGKAALYAGGTWILLAGIVPAMSCLYGVSLILVVLVITVLVIRPSLALQGPSERGNDD